MLLRGANAVHLHRDGVLHSYLPGDDVPEWAVEKIGDPNVWADEEAPVVPGPVIAPTVTRTVPAVPQTELDSTPATATDSGRPPENGPGATRQVWADYAASAGVEVDAAWKREDIIGACAAAGR